MAKMNGMGGPNSGKDLGKDIGKNIGKNITNGINKGFNDVIDKAKQRADNGNDFDVMNPEAINPDAEKAKKQSLKALKKALKEVGKLLKKLAKKLIELLVKLGPPGWIALAIIILVLIISMVISALNVMPGEMRNKLLELFNIQPTKWLMNEAVAELNSNNGKDIVDVARYLEEMNYSLIGDGFVTPLVQSESRKTKSLAEVLEENPTYEYRLNTEGQYQR